MAPIGDISAGDISAPETSAGGTRPRRLRRLSRGVLGAGALGIVVGLGLGIVLWQRSDAASGSPYVAEPVERGALTAIVRVSGTLAPRHQIDVRSVLAGVVTSVEVDHGARVRKGQVLARLDTTKLDLDLEHARAARETARARLLQVEAAVDEARAQLARFDQVHARSHGRVPSLHEVELQRAAVKRAEAERASVRAELQRAEAVLASLTTDRARAVLRAPIDGVVLARAIEPGQVIAASLQGPALFTIAEDLRRLQLVLKLAETDVGHVAVGQHATVRARAYPERAFEATVAEVRFAAEIVDGAVTYATVLHVDNDDLALRPGMTADVNLLVREVTNAVLVPNRALQFAPERGAAPPEPRGPPSERRVWVLRGGETLEIPIVVGLTDGTRTEVRDGRLSPGELVIVAAHR